MTENEEFEFRARHEQESAAPKRNLLPPREQEQARFKAEREAKGDFTLSMSGPERVRAGIGMSFAKMGRGIGQRLGMVSPEEVEEARKRDQPLADTVGGSFGGLLGEAVPLAAISALAPWANTVLGSGAVGAARGAIEPTAQGESVLRNAAVGGLVGSGATAAVKAVGKGASTLLDRSERHLLTEATENQGRDALIREAKDLGYKLTPTQAGAGKAARMAEGMAGTAKMEKAASFENQKVTNRLIQEDLQDSLKGLGIQKKITKLDDTVLEDIRDQAGAAYKAVDRLKNVNWDPKFDRQVSALTLKSPSGAISHPAEGAIDELITSLKAHPNWSGASLRDDITRLRELARSNFAVAQRSGGDIEKSSLAQAQKKAASLLEDLAERNLMHNGAPSTVIQDYKAARQLMAKTYDVGNAMDEGGNVSARTLAKFMDKGKPLTGNMEKVARVGSQFEGSVRDVSKMRDAAESSFADLAAGIAASLATGNHLAAGVAVARPTARAVMLSKIGQKMAGTPTYNPNLGLRLSDLLANNAKVQQGVPLASLAAMNSQQQ